MQVASSFPFILAFRLSQLWAPKKRMTSDADDRNLLELLRVNKSYHEHNYDACDKYMCSCHEMHSLVF